MVNNRCILCYGLNDEEKKIISELFNYKILYITKEMAAMKICDLLNCNNDSSEDNGAKEKVILFNGLSDPELNYAVKAIRKNIQGLILAVVTETSINWHFNELLDHLIKEREWHRSQQKGRS